MEIRDPGPGKVVALVRVRADGMVEVNDNGFMRETGLRVPLPFEGMDAMIRLCHALAIRCADLTK